MNGMNGMNNPNNMGMHPDMHHHHHSIMSMMHQNSMIMVAGETIPMRPDEISRSLPIPEYKIGWIIGKHGSYINQLAKKSGASISISDSSSKEYGTVWKYVQIRGSGRAVDRAKKLLHIRLERLEPRPVEEGDEAGGCKSLGEKDGDEGGMDDLHGSNGDGDDQEGGQYYGGHHQQHQQSYHGYRGGGGGPPRMISTGYENFDPTGVTKTFGANPASRHTLR